MDMHSKLQDITHLDIVTLQHFVEAQHTGKPTPSAFTDSIVRLSKRGFICGDQSRTFLVTAKGENFLKSNGKAAADSQTH